MNPVLVVRVQFLGDRPSFDLRRAVVEAIHAGTNPDVCAVIESKWEEPSPAERSDRALQLLNDAYSALGGLKRAGLPLDPDWTVEADASYEAMGEFLYPSSVLQAQERTGTE